MRTDTKITGHVTATQMREGIAGDCHRCAVALALSEATGDNECMVAEIGWILRLEVWGRWIAAPSEVRRFVYALAELDRDDDGRPILPEEIEDSDVKPFEFTLPPHDDPDWEAECDGCGDLFDPAELDDGGYCEGCREGEAGEQPA